MGQTPQPETDVLRPLARSDTDTDDWPQILLSNARIFRQGEREELVDLLLATEHHPVTVVGTVSPHTIENKLLRAPPTQKRPGKVAIEVQDVRTFAYGQFDNGAIALWAAGRAGWYTIQPAKSYAPVYDRMTEAIRTLYFVADAYREERRTGKGRNSSVLPPYTAQELFQKYALDVLRDPSAASEAASLVYKHRGFLLTSMISGKEGIEWEANPLYLHLRKKFAKEHATILQCLARPAKAAPTRSIRQGSQGPVTSEDTVKRRAGRPRKKQTSGGSSGSVRPIDVSCKPANPVMVPETSVPTDTDTNSFPDVAARRSGRRRVKDSPPVDESSSHEVAETSLPATPMPEISESEDGIPLARKGKSILRPKHSHATKSARSRHATELDDDEVVEHPSSLATSKRKAEEPLNGDSSKRNNNNADFDEDINIPESPSIAVKLESTLEADPGGETDSKTPTDSRDDETMVPNPTQLIHREDPVGEDTWVCALDGCTHRVYSTSEPESQRLIREHYALHAYDDDERIKLVKKLQHPSLPVSHLMEKVRLQAKLEGFPGSRWGGSRFPPAVV